MGFVENDLSVSEQEIQMIDQYSKNIDMQDIGLFWQLTIKTIDDLRVVGNENLTLEMYVIQLVHLKNLDEEKEPKNQINISSKEEQSISEKKLEDNNLDKILKNQVKSQLKYTNQIKATPSKDLVNKDSKKVEILSFQNLIDHANKEKEIELKYDLERNVKLVSFSKRKIDISFNEKLNKNFIKNLTEKLIQWTGERWIISLSKNTEAKSIHEKNLISKDIKIEEFKKSSIAKEIEIAFPDAKLIDIKSEE